VSGLASRLTEERVPVIGGMVRDIAAELTAALGGAAPPVRDAVRQPD